MLFAKNLLNLFEDNWNTSVKVVQKDANFMFRRNPTNIIGVDNKLYLNINCGDWVKVDEKYFDTKVTNNDDFADRFELLCKRVIDKEFTMFRNPEADNEDWLHWFVEEQHGSGVSSLFWLYYQIRLNDVKYIVIDNIDSFLHYLSMEQLGRIFKNINGYKFIFLMNNDVLFTTSIMDIDDLYMLHGDKITNIRECTDRELRVAHNLRNLLRAGEFDEM